MFKLAEYSVPEYPYWLNILYRNIPTDSIFCTGISVLTQYFALEYPSSLNICTGISKVTDYFALEYQKRTEHFVTEYPNGLNILHWDTQTN
jgi:hypothetical protein